MSWEIDSQDEDTIVLKRVGAGTGGLGILAVIYIIHHFISTYWFYIVAIGIIAVVCAVICVLIGIFSEEPVLKILVTVAIAIGLSIGVIYFGDQIQERINSDYAAPTSYRASETSSTYAYVLSDGLNVRSGPSSDYYSIDVLEKGTRVYVLEVVGNWCKIQYDDIEGYVNSKYLDIRD